MRFKNILTIITIVFLLVSDANAVTFRKIVLEDMSIGSGTYTSPSGKVTGKTKINAGSFPFKPSSLNTKSPNDWADRGFDTPIYPGTLISGGPEISILKYDADNDGAISGSEFAAMVSGIGSTQTTLLVDVISTVSATIALPSTLSVRFISPGKLIINTGVTLTPVGPLTAPPYKIFEYAGTGTIGAGSITGASPVEWWGGGTYVAAAVNTVAINQALIASSDVYISEGTYNSSSTIDIPTETTFRGTGRASIINYTGSGNAVSIDELDWDDHVNAIEFTTIMDMKITCAGGSVADQHGIYVNGAHLGSLIENVWVYNAGDTGIFIRGWAHGFQIVHNKISSCDSWGIQILTQDFGLNYSSNIVTVTRNEVVFNGGGIHINDLLKTNIVFNWFEDNGALGEISVVDCAIITIVDNYIENSTSGSTSILIDGSQHSTIDSNFLSHGAAATSSTGIECISAADNINIKNNRIFISATSGPSSIGIDLSTLSVARIIRVDQDYIAINDEWGTKISDGNSTAKYSVLSTTLGIQGANKQSVEIKSRTEELTAMSGATITSVGIPVGSIVLGVSARVTTLIEGATTIDIGESGGDTDLYIDGMAVAKDTTADIEDSNAAFTGPKAYQTAGAVLVTAVGGAANFSAGALRLTLYYIELTPPTD